MVTSADTSIGSVLSGLDGLVDELRYMSMCVFFFNDTATTEIYTLSLHDALPICAAATRTWQYKKQGAAATRNGQYKKRGAAAT